MRGALVLALTGAVALAAAPAAGAPQRKKVQVADYFFAPAKLTVNKGSQITWDWSADNTDTHDVKLLKGPTGVRKWSSEIAATDYTFKRTLRRPGTYQIFCTLHPEDMTMTIKVRRR